MRISIIAWLTSFMVMSSGALLAALARDSTERPRDRCTMTFPIEAASPEQIRRPAD
jgi:hypothetical protein